MCGIAGIYRPQGPVHELELYRMIDSLKHRGPDDDGTYVDGNVGLGFVRLSIIDLSRAGHQPMLNADESIALIFNGEIYNYLELKECLKEFNFRSETDSEVVLYAYQKWGKDCVHRFNGMFAFAIYDKIRKEVFVARDRFGVKPFYYYLDQNQFIFASEIPAILNVLDSSPSPNSHVLYDFLVYNRTNHSEDTFFSGIRKLQHGHTLTVAQNKVTISRWYSLKDSIPSTPTTISELKETFISAVKLRLRSDVPVGACLSGGLDSSSIVAVAVKQFDFRNLNTFSAVYSTGERGDETSFIKEWQECIKNMHYVHPTAETLYQDLEHFILTMQEPVPSTSAYAEYKVFQLAKKYVTVILNGQGPDEAMAGYYYMLGFFYGELLRSGNLPQFFVELFFDLTKHKSLEGLKSLIYSLLPSTLKPILHNRQKSVLSSDFLQTNSNASIIQDTLFSSSTLREALINHFEHKFEHHLIWSDRSSMRFSLEARFPFLDYRFVEKALALPLNEVVHHGTTKVGLRKAMRGLLPERIVNRQDKVGYETPEDSWLRNEKMATYIGDILSSKSFTERGIFNASRVKHLFEQHIDNKASNASIVWKAFHLELWARNFLDHASRARFTEKAAS